MSDKHDNLDSSGSDAINSNLEPKYGLEIDAIPDTSSIFQLFRTCSWNYEMLLSTLQTDTSHSAHTSISLVPEIKDEFSRLRIWGEQTYAVLPQNTRRSLDQQLRADQDTKKIVIRCLQRLNNHVEKAIEQTKKFPPTAYVDTEDEEYSSLSDESDAVQEGLETFWEIRFRKTIKSVFEGIRSLYRVSTLLRRPQNSSQYLRSSTSTAISPDALRVTLDYAHVLQKIRQWRHLTMRSRLGGDEGHVVTEEEIQLKKENEQQEIADIAFFCQRLAWANFCRREQFDYCIDHPDIPESQKTASDVASQRERKALLERLSKTVAKLEQTKVDTETLHQQATSDANNADSSRANKYKRSTYLRSMSYDDYGGWDIDAPIRETRSPRGPTDAPPPPPKPTMIRMNPKSKNLHQAFAIREENQRRQRAYERQLDAYYGA
ncbi:hypothetical protein KCU95_g8069, partial [Aureobasidium melanogenum]